MHHDLTIITPNNPQQPRTNTADQPQPAPDMEQFYQTAASAPTDRTPGHPEAALQASLHQQQQHERIANRLPNLKKSALILIGIIVFSALQAVAMQSVLIGALGAAASGTFVTIANALGWAIGLACAILLLNTKSTTLTKRLLLVIGVAIAYFAVTDLVSVNLIGLAIDGFMLWWTYDLYQSVEALEI